MSVSGGLRPLPPVYGRAPEYLQAGLGWPLPLPSRQKQPPPSGFTGREGACPTPARVGKWALAKPHHNLALRLAPGVLGLDVDAYPPKLGRATFARAIDAWGPLPPTFRSSARADGLSGIHLYRVPLDVNWPSLIPATLAPGTAPGHIELVHYGLRYVVAWPSIHPQGGRYEWWSGDVVLAAPPRLRDLPDLPEEWVEGLSGLTGRPPVAGPPMASPTRAGRAVSLAQAGDAVRSAPEGERNEVLNRAAYAAGGNASIREANAREVLVRAAREAGLSAREATATFDGGWTAGRLKPYR